MASHGPIALKNFTHESYIKVTYFARPMPNGIRLVSENGRMTIFLICSLSLYVLLHLAVKRAVDNPDYSVIREDFRPHRNYDFWR